jgi:hypothetical protein
VPWPAVSGTSRLGYAFAAWLSLHVFLNRAWPHLASVGAAGGGGAEIGLGFVSHAFARKGPLVGPAYLMLLLSGVGHMVWGMAKFWGYSPKQVGPGIEAAQRRKRRWYVINATWAAVGAVWFAGMGVVVRGGEAMGWVAKQYDALLGSMPGLGRLFR